MKKSFADILQDFDSVQKRKLATKVPEWADTEGLQTVSSLALEQCSSSATARYKAALAARILEGKKRPCIADLTGGLGVDSWAFSQVAPKVVYNELNTKLADAVRENFKLLGVGNVSVSNTDALICLSSLGQVDLVYLDPSRRDKAGKKVFLLEDCEPNILDIKHLLFSYCPNVLLKLSPMADISLVAERLGMCLREVHVVGTGGECKELVCWLEKTHRGGYTITVADLPDEPFTFRAADEAAAEPRFAANVDELAGKAVIIPGAVALKSGCANLLCQRNGWIRLGRHTSIYVSDDGNFRVTEILPFNKSNIRALGKKYPFSEVTARNIPVTSEELKRKMGVASSDNTHIYACTCDFADGSSGKYLIVTRREQAQ